MLVVICHRPGDIADAISGRVQSDLARAIPHVRVLGSDDIRSAGPGPARTGEPADGGEGAARCDVLLVVIDRTWLTPALFEQRDSVRETIELALRRGIRLVPLLVDGAELPTADQLPASIRGILECQAHVIRSGSEYAGNLGALANGLRGAPRSPTRRAAWLVRAGALTLLVTAIGVATFSMMVEPSGQALDESGDAGAGGDGSEENVRVNRGGRPSGGPASSGGAASSKTSPPEPSQGGSRPVSETPSKQHRDGTPSRTTRTPQWCTVSCQERGRCFQQGDSCVARSEADCRASTGCKRSGRCNLANGACVISSDADCRNSGDCVALGKCGFKAGECKALSSVDCRNSALCRNEGKCTAFLLECSATKTADCKASKICKDTGRCVPKNGNCVAL